VADNHGGDQGKGLDMARNRRPVVEGGCFFSTLVTHERPPAKGSRKKVPDPFSSSAATVNNTVSSTATVIDGGIDKLASQEQAVAHVAQDAIVNAVDATAQFLDQVNVASDVMKYMPSAYGVEITGSSIIPWNGGFKGGIGFHLDFDNPSSDGFYTIAGTGSGLDVGVSGSAYVAYGTKGNPWNGPFAGWTVGAGDLQVGGFHNSDGITGWSAGGSIGLPVTWVDTVTTYDKKFGINPNKW
jgi:hypothetical protein